MLSHGHLLTLQHAYVQYGCSFCLNSVLATLYELLPRNDRVYRACRNIVLVGRPSYWTASDESATARQWQSELSRIEKRYRQAYFSPLRFELCSDQGGDDTI